MTAQIPRSKRIVGDPACQQFSSGAVISPEQAKTILRSVNSKKKIIPDDFPLAEELILVLVEYRVLTEIKDTDLTMAESRKYLSELVKSINRFEEVSDLMGEFVFVLLYRNDAFGSYLAGPSRSPISDAFANKEALESALRSWRDACTAAQSQLKGARPGKKYNTDTAVRLLADVYEKGSGRNASAKDYEDTPFTRFASSALPLFGLETVAGHALRRILRGRRAQSS